MKSRDGFTLVEVLVAIMVLTTGLLAVAAGSGSIYRMLGSGRRSSAAAAVAQNRLEAIRRIANRTNPRCTDGSLVSGNATQAGGIAERWIVAGTGASRTITEIVVAPTSRGTSTDTIFATLECL
ncbi:MAG TPA: prepilin-type N-terminal cleavage/methylation domain-containing protein [Gemmatimonadales bacterium]|nr:prepilin-type N-terminal cleavage/methylation domain-containing protein [Gemmatimonadales bacterium]